MTTPPDPATLIEFAPAPGAERAPGSAAPVYPAAPEPAPRLPPAPAHAGSAHAGSAHAGPAHAGAVHAAPVDAAPAHAAPDYAAPGPAAPDHAAPGLAYGPAAYAAPAPVRVPPAQPVGAGEPVAFGYAADQVLPLPADAPTAGPLPTAATEPPVGTVAAAGPGASVEYVPSPDDVPSPPSGAFALAGGEGHVAFATGHFPATAPMAAPAPAASAPQSGSAVPPGPSPVFAAIGYGAPAANDLPSGEPAPADRGAYAAPEPSHTAQPEAGLPARLSGGISGGDALGELLGTVLGSLAAGARERGGPLPAGGPRVVDAAVRRALDGDPLPEHGVGAREALAALTRVLAYGSTDPADPLCAGHLHCPPLAVAVAADLAASALNPSLDSWDQAPAATAMETEVVAALAGLTGFAPGLAGGTVTTGGTESNLLGLLLARDREGPSAGRHRVLCSDAAHFSVRRSAALLGMGDDAVVPVATGTDHRIDPGALDAVCRRVLAANDRPTAIVATAGTTDLGAVDPLAACADVAREHGVWLHVDAAYGGGALFSDRLAPLLHGVDRADSVGLDLHKLGWQPVAAGVFLVRDRALFAPLTQRAKYLNPPDDEDAGLPSLLGHSPRTTRRADVFKIAVTLRALGREGLGALVDRCHALARHAAARIDRDPGPGALELTAEPVLTTVVFRYVPHPHPGECPARHADLVNAELRRRLLTAGQAVVGRTEVGTGPGSVRLKLTLLNPYATERDVDALLHAVVAAGRAAERDL